MSFQPESLTVPNQVVHCLIITRTHTHQIFNYSKSTEMRMNRAMSIIMLVIGSSPYRVRGCHFFCRHHFRFSGRISFGENLPLKNKQLVLLPFGQCPRLTAVEQDWADQGLVNGEFCLAWKVARLQMFAHSEEAPICSLDSSLYFQTHVIRWCHQGS
jgi:hypothetical protein